MADQKYTVQVDFALGQTSKANLEKEVAEVQKKAAEGAKAVPVRPPQVDAAILGAWKTEFDQIQKEMEDLNRVQDKVWNAGKKASKDYQKIVGDSTRTVDELYDAIMRQVGAEELQMRAIKELRRRTAEVRAESAILRRSAADMELFARAAMIAGTAVLGGIFAYANKYVQEAEHATAVTVKWKKEQEGIRESTSRIGEVFAREMLPFLRQAAGFIEKAANFIESHPEIVPTAVRVGEILIGVGVIGKAVATGIRLTADALTIQASVMRLQAARMDQDSSTKSLVAAQINAGAANKNIGAGGIGGAAAKGGAAAMFGEAAVLLGSFAAGLIVTDRVFDQIEKRNVTMADYMVTLKQAIAIDAKALGDFFGKNADWSLRPGQQSGGQDLGDNWFKKLGQALGLLEKEADDAADALGEIDLSSVANSPAREQILKAYEDYLKDEQELVRRYNDERNKIMQNSMADTVAATRKYAADVAKVQRDLTQALAKATADFHKANAEAEQNYQNERADILNDEAAAIEKIQQDLQERLAKLALENHNKLAELIAARDAVGLIKQQRRYQQEVAEANQEANKELRERRQQTQQRLAELRQDFEQERAERAADYANRVAEIRLQAAERLAELRIQHQEELTRIRTQRNERLRELDLQHKEERNRRYLALVATIRDLDASLLGEQRLRATRQTEMLRDLDAWLVSYRNKMASGLNSLPTPMPTKDAGGYVSRGVYKMAWDNQKEFVLSGPTTRAAERILGANLNQEMLVRALQGGANTNYIDQRRMEVPMSKEQLALFRESAIDVLSKVIGGR